MKKKIVSIIVVLIGGLYFLIDESYSFEDIPVLNDILENNNEVVENVTLDEIPEYSDSFYVVINNNIPFFTEDELNKDVYEEYFPLDSLGRAVGTSAMIDETLMPTEDRGSIGQVKPTGWHTVKYDIVSGNYLYNRSHLIGHQLTGEDATEENLITGTRSFNVEGMLPFENMVADYIKETGNKVMYRVTPIYDGDNLLASGVLMEAKSIEDSEIEFCVYIYNVEPGININYSTGESSLN